MTTAAVTEVSERAARPRSALAALARAEGWRLIRHPLFLIGMAFTTATLLIANSNSPSEGADFQQEIVDFLVGNAFLLVGGGVWTFLATFLAASRMRRDGAEDFYAGQPVTPRMRTAAALLSVGWAGAAAAALIAVATLLFLGPDGAHHVLGTRIAASPVELAQGPLYVVLAGVIGVSLGTWTRNVYIALLAAVLMLLPPLALIPWFVFDDEASRGFFGAVGTSVPPGWHVLAMAGLMGLAASLAMLRHDRRLRVGLLAAAGLAVTAAVAIGSPTNNGLTMACAPSELPPVGSPRVVPAPDTPGNFDFERGDLGGWHVRTQGSGAWRVYEHGRTPPDATDSDLSVPFDVVDPPQGRFAAVTDMCAAGSRILYRDVTLTEPGALRFTLFYRSAAPLSSSRTLDHMAPFANVQFRVDVMDPAAPVDSLAPRHILGTVFRTTPGDDLEFGPRQMSFDMSPWDGRKVRLRFAEVDNAGPLRVVIDNVWFDPAGS